MISDGVKKKRTEVDMLLDLFERVECKNADSPNSMIGPKKEPNKKSGSLQYLSTL